MTVNRHDVLEQIRDALVATLEIERESVTEDTVLAELGVDSLEMASIALEWEHEYGVSFSDERIVTIKTIGEAIDALEEAVAGRVGAGAR